MPEEVDAVSNLGKPDAYGLDEKLTIVDRLGVWLSGRQVRRFVDNFTGKTVGDFGCGYDATFSRTIVNATEKLYLADFNLADDLRNHPRIIPMEGDLVENLQRVPSGELDVSMCVSVLEHFGNPLEVLIELHRTLRPNGILLVNVPSWLGKSFLEFSAFRLSLSPFDSVNDHKMYYNPRDLWPLLIRAGFAPSQVNVFRHKFGLNTFAVCKSGV